MRLLATTFILFLAIPALFAQNAPGTPINIRKTETPIKLDGVLDDPAWQNAQVADSWYTNFPVDTVPAAMRTEAMVAFDDQFLYVAFYCEDDTTPDLINSLRRDFDYETNDNVGVVLGPYNDRLNGFFFYVTPAGVQMEGLISGGGSGDGYNIFWDNKWYSKVIRHADHWTVEMAIPFKSFRYKNGLSEWNIAFDRSDRKRNAQYSWIATPIQFNTASFAYSGQLVWEEPAPPAGANISLIPYIAGGGAIDRQVPNPELDTRLGVGFDAKVSVTPSLNLDITVNPDFSQVEVDNQVINLTRFEIQLPERRQFFLENSDLLDNAGFPNARPFFSRRVGLVQDSNQLFQQVPILFGARLSGSLSPIWRINVLNMQTQESTQFGLPAQNFTAASIQRNFGAQSSLTLTGINKYSLNVNEGDSVRFFHESIFRPNAQGITQINRSNQSLTADLELLSTDNQWYHSSFVSRSFASYADGNAWAGAAFNRFQNRNWEVFLGANFVGEDYYAETGFVPSENVYPGQINGFLGLNYNHYPQAPWLIRMGPEINLNQTYIPDGTLTDQDYRIGYSLNFSNTASVSFAYNYVFQRLTFDFNPVDSDFTPFLTNETYDWHVGSISFSSDQRKLFNFDVEANYGGFYNGTNLNLNGRLTYRYQPYGNVSLQFDYNNVELAPGYGADQLFLIGPRIDLTFTDALFLTTFVQYNSRLDNVLLNARFQWRYQPASDFFIVYTENYLAPNFESKNRALVFKLVYWLNV